MVFNYKLPQSLKLNLGAMEATHMEPSKVEYNKYINNDCCCVKGVKVQLWRLEACKGPFFTYFSLLLYLCCFDLEDS